jgi:hypothetical protein
MVRQTMRRLITVKIDTPVLWTLMGCLLLTGCPTDGDDDDDDDTTEGDDDDDTTGPACDPLAAGQPLDWDGGSALAVGDVAQLEGDGGSFAIEFAEDGDYLAVLISRDRSTDTAWDVAVNGGGRGGHTTDAGAPVFVPPQATHPVALRDPIGDPTVPGVGDVRTFEVPGLVGAVEVDAEAVIVTDEMVVYEDISTPYDPPYVLDASFVADVIEQFEQIALPRERFFFHTESDVNDDGHVSVLFSYRVNMSGAQAFVTSCDLQPADVCGYGNEQELIYVGIPDPDAPQSSVNGTTELLAHEFNHNIYWASRFLDNDVTDTPENVYMTEGTSAMAQDLCGYNNGNLYVWAAALDDPWHTSIPDVFEYTPGVHYYADRDGQLRGLAYLAFRYLFDRYGAEVAQEDGTFDTTCGVTFLNDFFTTPTTGLDGIEQVTGLDAESYILDFWTAMGAHQRVDEGMATDPIWGFQPPSEDVLTGYQRGVDFDMTIHGWYEVSGVATAELTTGSTEELRAGGAAFLLGEGVIAGTAVTLEVDASADAVLRVIRLD